MSLRTAFSNLYGHADYLRMNNSLYNWLYSLICSYNDIRDGSHSQLQILLIVRFCLKALDPFFISVNDNLLRFNSGFSRSREESKGGSKVNFCNCSPFNYHYKTGKSTHTCALSYDVKTISVKKQRVELLKWFSNISYRFHVHDI